MGKMPALQIEISWTIARNVELKPPWGLIFADRRHKALHTTVVCLISGEEIVGHDKAYRSITS